MIKSQKGENLIYEIKKSVLVDCPKRTRYLPFIKKIFRILNESHIEVVKEEIRFKEEVNIYKIINLYCDMLKMEFAKVPPEKIVYHIDIPKLENPKYRYNHINFHLRERDLEKNSKYVFYFQLEYDEVK